MEKTFIDDQCILVYGSKLTSKEKIDLKDYLSTKLVVPKNQIVLMQRGKAFLVKATNAHTLITCPDCDGIPGGVIPINPLGPGGGPIHYPDFILRSQTLNINSVGRNNFETYY